MARASLLAGEETRSDHREVALFEAGIASASGTSTGPGSEFALDTASAALATQARCYVYSKQNLTKSTFEDPAWREALHSAFMHGVRCGGGARHRDDKMPFLSSKGLRQWLLGEYRVFLLFSTFIGDMMGKYHEGNAWGQGLHDAATLKNHHKMLAAGMQLTLPNPELMPKTMLPLEPPDEDDASTGFLPSKGPLPPTASSTANHADVEEPQIPRINLLLTMGMVRLENGRDQTAASVLRVLCVKVFGVLYETVAHSTISDVAAAGVAKLFHEYAQLCEMHIGDKLPRAMVGDLVRTQNKVPINPFDACQRLLGILQAIATYFSYSTRHETMIKMADILEEGSTALIRIEVQHNGTRVSARHGLIRSLIRMSKLVRLYGAAHGGPCLKLNDEIMDTTLELEAYMQVTCNVCTMVQYEEIYMKALGYPIIYSMMTKIKADTISVIDLSRLTSSPRLIRRDKRVRALTAIGKEARDRLILEAEKRHGDNPTENLNGSMPTMSTSDKIACLLDPRTANCEHFPDDVRSDWAEECKSLLCEAYCEYGENAYQYHASRNAARKKPIPVDIPEEKNKEDSEEGAESAAAPAAKTRRVSAFAAVNNRAAQTSTKPKEVPVDDGKALRKQKLTDQFQRVFLNYAEYCLDIEWGDSDKFPELDDLPEDGPFDLVNDLLRADVTTVLDDMIRSDPTRVRFGFLPYMATGSKGSVGQVLASSYCERINSAANKTPTKDKANLSDDDIGMLVTLRMNANFMAYMRTYYNHISLQQFNQDGGGASA